MGKSEVQRRLDEALNKAFAAKNDKVRRAYMDLAEFYERQVCRAARVDSTGIYIR